MISCTLNNQIYIIDFVSARALREMGEATKVYASIMRASSAAAKGEEIKEDVPVVSDAMDALVRWFCVVFGDQFTPDDVYNYYPADRFMADVVLCLMAVQSQTTEVLKSFPTRPAETMAEM